MRKNRLLAGTAAAMLLSGCGADSEVLTPPVPAAELAVQTITGKDADDDFRAAQYAFALELFRSTLHTKDGENTMVSPYSVIEALAMTANGAAGDTRTEAEQVLGSGLPLDDLNQYLYTWRCNQPDTKRCKLKTANGIWMRDDDFDVYSAFLQLTETYYGAELRKAPFNSDTVDEINKWVKRNTDGMIPAIINELKQADKMVLVNAVCFDAKWRDKYKSEDIKERMFCNADGTEQTVTLLYSDEADYLEQGDTVGFLRYYDGPYAFAGILPPEDVSVQEWLDSLTAADLLALLNNRQQTDVRAAIPEFTCDTDAELREILAEMGMPQAFTEEADFSGISDTPLKIGSVVHKTHIELDANGTKAAAATAVIMQKNGAEPIEPEPKYVILNRPFVYVILDTQTNLPVFIGTVQQL